MSAVSIQPLPPGATATFKVISPTKQEQDCFISQLGVSKIGASLHWKLSLVTPTEDTLKARLCNRDIIQRGLGTAVKEAWNSRGWHHWQHTQWFLNTRWLASAQHTLSAGNCQDVKNKLWTPKIHSWLFTFWAETSKWNLSLHWSFHAFPDHYS